MRMSATLLGSFLGLLVFSPIGSAQQNNLQQAQNNPRQCQVVEGVVVCRSEADSYADMDARQKGEVIYNEADIKNGPAIGYGGEGYGDSQSRFTALVKNKDGSERRREVRLKYLENSPNGDMRIAIFDKPNDLKRYALLTISHPQGLDEQWIYDPDSKQVRRAASNNAATPFSGMDVSYEDISAQDVAKYDYEYLAEREYQGKPVHVVNRYPKDKYSGYRRLETWLTQDDSFVVKVDYYDDSDRLIKTLTLNDYQQFDNKYWRARHMLMENHMSGGSTELIWSEYRFNTGLSANDFTPANLRNIN